MELFALGILFGNTYSGNLTPGILFTLTSPETSNSRYDVSPLILELLNQAKNIPLVLLRSTNKSIEGFLGYDRTSKKADRLRNIDHYFIYFFSL